MNSPSFKSIMTNRYHQDLIFILSVVQILWLINFPQLNDFKSCGALEIRQGPFPAKRVDCY